MQGLHLTHACHVMAVHHDVSGSSSSCRAVADFY